jgi:hypothetical protein
MLARAGCAVCLCGLVATQAAISMASDRMTRAQDAPPRAIPIEYLRP